MSGPRHPDFEPGNTAALVRDGDSPRTIEARAAEVREQLFEIAPWLDKAAFVPAVARFLRAEAREQLIHQHIAKWSAEKGPGARPRAALGLRHGVRQRLDEGQPRPWAWIRSPTPA